MGLSPEDVGLVTGNRRENPDARVLVVVAEILLNRLLHSGKGTGTGTAAEVAVASDQWPSIIITSSSNPQSLIPNPLSSVRLQPGQRRW